MDNRIDHTVGMQLWDAFANGKIGTSVKLEPIENDSPIKMAVMTGIPGKTINTTTELGQFLRGEG